MPDIAGGRGGSALFDDQALPFQIESSGLRGRLVRFGPALHEILNRHAYPPPVAALLGEMLTLAVLMATALKFDGFFTLQAKGNGPVSLLVADITSDGALRGYASYDAEKVAAASTDASASPVATWLGDGHLAFTIDQGEHTQRYQGIVQLVGETLASCLQHYFRQSEQIDAGIEVAVGKAPSGQWRSGGLMIQRVPDRQSAQLPTDREDDWRRAMVLMASVTQDELLSPSLASTELLYRLFHEDGVRVFDPVPLEMRCRCSAERVETMLRSFPRSEIETLKIDDNVVVTCEFCGHDYVYSDSDIENIYNG